MLGGNQQEKKYPYSLHATETGIGSGLMSHLARMQTLPLPLPSPALSFSCKSNSFSYGRFCTKTSFETETQGNWMAYFCGYFFLRSAKISFCEKKSRKNVLRKNLLHWRNYAYKHRMWNLGAIYLQRLSKQERNTLSDAVVFAEPLPEQSIQTRARRNCNSAIPSAAAYISACFSLTCQLRVVK